MNRGRRLRSNESNAKVIEMFIAFAHTVLPDAVVWPGRRVLAVVDAVLWPVIGAHLLVVNRLDAGAFGGVLVTILGVLAIARTHRAFLRNERYRFTTWTWGRWLAWLLASGWLLKLAMSTLSHG